MHCKTRWIYHLHGLLRSLLGGFPSRQLWGQLPMWLECSGECKYVQDQLFYTFLSGDSPACASPWVHYKTKLHLLNGKSLHCGFSVSAKGHRIVDLFLPSTVNDLINAHSQINAPYLIDAPLEVYSLYYTPLSNKRPLSNRRPPPSPTPPPKNNL